jgi:predicted small metal-binding protein
MAKVLRCRDVGLDCEGELRADTEEELLRQAAEHAQTAHQMKDMPPEVVAKVRAAIRDVDETLPIGESTAGLPEG